MENLEPIELEIAIKSDAAVTSAQSLDKNLKDLDGSVDRTRQKFKEYSKEQQQTARAINSTKKAVASQRKTFDDVNRGLNQSGAVAANSARRFDALGNSVNQITRELPAFTYSAQTGFMAISNNIPILADAIGRLKQENANLVASGQKAVPVWKQLAGSLFSWNTALSLGVTLITVYGREIASWISNLFKGKDSVNSLRMSVESLNAAFESDSYKKAVKSMLELRSEFKAARDGIIDKEKALKSYNETVGEVMGKVNDFTSAEKKLIDQGDDYVKMMLYKSSALVGLEKASEEIAQNEKKKNELEKALIDLREQAKDLSSYDGITNNSWGGTSSSAKQLIEDSYNSQKKAIEDYEKKIKSLESTSIDVYQNMIDKAKKISDKNKFNLFGGDKKNDAKKIEDEYKRLLTKLAELDKEYAKPTFDKSEQEVIALKGKFEKIRELIKEFNSKPGNKLKIGVEELNALEKKSVKTLRYRQETEQLKSELKKQKRLFEEFEAYKSEVGEKEATNRFKKDLKGFETYVQFLKSKLDELKGQDGEQPEVKERIRQLTAMLEVATDDAKKDSGKRFAKLLDEYKGYAQSVRLLEEKLNADVATLEDNRNENNEREVNAAIAKRKAKYQEDLNNLQASILQSSTFYERLFSDLSKKGYRTLKEFAEHAAKVINSATTYNTTDGKTMVRIEFDQINEQGEIVKRVSNITVAEFERIKRKANELNNELQNRNPFAGVVKSFRDVLSAAREGDTDALSGAIESLGQSASKSNNIFQDWGHSLEAIFGAGVGDAVDNIAELSGAVVDLGVGIGRIASGDVVGGISSAISGIATLYKKITGWLEKAHEQQVKMMLADYDALRAIRQKNYELQKSVTYLKAYRHQQELLRKLIDKGVVSQDGMTNKYLHDLARLKKLIDLQKKELSVNDDLLKKLNNERFSAEISTGSASSESISGVIGGTLEELKERFSKFNTTLSKETSRSLELVKTKEEWIELLNQKGWLTGGAKELYEAWKKSGKALDEYAKEYQQLMEETRTAVMGENFDSFVNNYADALFRMRGNVAEFADWQENKIKSSLMSSFKYQFLASQLKPLYEEMSEMLTGGIDNLSEDKIEKLGNQFNTVFKTSTRQLDKLSKKLGIDITEGQKDVENSNTLKGAVKGITEEQADLLAGQLGGLRLTQIATNQILKNSFTELGAQTSRMVAVQIKIEANTKRTAENTEHLKPISDAVRSIDNHFKGDKLKGNGIKR